MERATDKYLKLFMINYLQVQQNWYPASATSISSVLFVSSNVISHPKVFSDDENCESVFYDFELYVKLQYLWEKSFFSI